MDFLEETTKSVELLSCLVTFASNTPTSVMKYFFINNIKHLTFEKVGMFSKIVNTYFVKKKLEEFHFFLIGYKGPS